MNNRIYSHEVTYFIQGEITQRIKIGKTTTAVSERIRNLQAGSPDKLKLLGVCFGPKRTERYLHSLFSEHRLHGEWFSPSKGIMEFISNNCIHDESAFYHIYRRISHGELTFDEALGIGTPRLMEIADRHNDEVMKNMYVDENSYNILTGKKV